MSRSTILEVNTGRVASVRLGPNEDLVEALDQAAAQLGFRRALVRSGLGSLIDATFVGAPTGAVWAGRFARGLNPVCITIEAVLEELLAAPEEDWRRPF